MNEYLEFSFELNIELNDFLALFNVWMNNQNLSPRASGQGCQGGQGGQSGRGGQDSQGGHGDLKSYQGQG